VKGLDVGFRVHGQRFDAQFAASPNDAEGNFAAIGDEDFLNHVDRR
jgi:hypothetical protein